MIAPWIPVTVVPTSFATVAIETFITELSSVIRNWPAASVSRTICVPERAALPSPVMPAEYPPSQTGERRRRRAGARLLRRSAQWTVKSALSEPTCAW